MGLSDGMGLMGWSRGTFTWDGHMGLSHEMGHMGWSSGRGHMRWSHGMGHIGWSHGTFTWPSLVTLESELMGISRSFEVIPKFRPVKTSSFSILEARNVFPPQAILNV